ncbi:MAG: HEAT repeat domain-containing protein [Planctomycetes bacterium]|nr:HEAT repeat domain-containing protein [Planctomycetota bacterium]
MGILALLATAALAQDFDKAKAEFRHALLSMHETRVRDAAQRIALSDCREAADALLDGYGITAQQIKQLWVEKVRWIREADSNSDIEWETTSQGSRPTERSMAKFLKLTQAQDKGKDVEKRIMRVEAVKRHIVDALATFRGDEAVRELIAKMKGDSSWDRRAGVAEVLGRVDHPAALPALLEQLKRDAEPGVRIACIDGIRSKKSPSPEAVAAVCEQLKHEFWQVKYAAATALQALGSKEAVEPLIEALKQLDGRLKHDVNAALVALTGVDKHGDYATWRSWYDANLDAVAGGTYAPTPDEKPAAERGGTTFYGIPVKSKNVIFVLDCSGSMMWDSEWSAPDATPTGSGEDKYGKPDGHRKIDIARWQLRRCPAQLPDGTEFNLIFFSSSWRIMSEKMVKMSASTRKLALDFVDRLQPEGGTNIYDPLEKAFSFAAAGELKDKPAKSGVDTIFLLTDGMPNSGQISDPSAILSKLRESNRLKKIAINTIGVFSSHAPIPEQANEKEEGERFLKQMADEHGGVFVDASGGKN